MKTRVFFISMMSVIVSSCSSLAYKNSLDSYNNFVDLNRVLDQVVDKKSALALKNEAKNLSLEFSRLEKLKKSYLLSNEEVNDLKKHMASNKYATPESVRLAILDNFKRIYREQNIYSKFRKTIFEITPRIGLVEAWCEHIYEGIFDELRCEDELNNK